MADQDQRRAGGLMVLRQNDKGGWHTPPLFQKALQRKNYFMACFLRKSAANVFMSVRSRTISLQPYHKA